MGGGRHVRTGAETGVTRPPVSDRRRPPEARDRKREGSAVGCRRERPCRHLDFGLLGSITVRY